MYSYRAAATNAIGLSDFSNVDSATTPAETEVTNILDVAVSSPSDDVEQYGDGNSARDYTFVDDIVDGILRALECCSGYHVWNLGGSRATPLGQLVQMIADKLGTQAKLIQLPAQPGDVELTWADVSRAKSELGWSPKIEIEDGLDRFLGWLKGQV